MGDVKPSLTDLILPLLVVEFPDMDWGDPPSYAPMGIIIGRYCGGFVIQINDNQVEIRNMEPLMAADPEFFDKMREGIRRAKNNIDLIYLR